MSKKIKDQIEEDNLQEKTFVIHPNEYQYLRSIDTIKQSVHYYHHQLQNEYMKIISLRLGYKPEQSVEFKIDLADDKRELTIKLIPQPEEDKHLDKKD